jgi:hypothetical protein
LLWSFSYSGTGEKLVISIWTVLCREPRKYLRINIFVIWKIMAKIKPISRDAEIRYRTASGIK